ncbi:MAG: hypothetical protein ACQKBW_08360 [Puniceicoccales bacterium]
MENVEVIVMSLLSVAGDVRSLRNKFFNARLRARFRLKEPMNAPATLSIAATITSWFFQIIAAVILLQTLFFKFTGAPESVYIFSKLGVEPWGRYGSGVAELIASILLLWPRFAWAGAILGVGVMLGALGAHLGPLGIDIVVDGESDGGLLFGLAVAVLASCLFVLVLRIKQIPFFAKK